MGPGQKAASALLGAMCMAWLGGCGDGLGECDPAMLGGDPAVGTPHGGQVIVASSCASGRCHSEGAEGVARAGAPADLNFDVIAGTVEENARLARAAATVVDWAEDMWGEIEGGTMPPEMPAGSGELSSADKETVRNWLACGAPAIGSAGGPTATWESIWPAMAGDCVGCHGSASAAGGNFVLGSLSDACASYDSLVMQPGTTMMCSGQTLVEPNNPAGSVLLGKLRATPGTCGAPMPLGAPAGLAGTKPELVGLVEAWIMNGAPPPANCP